MAARAVASTAAFDRTLCSRFSESLCGGWNAPRVPNGDVTAVVFAAKGFLLSCHSEHETGTYPYKCIFPQTLEFVGLPLSTGARGDRRYES